MKTVISKVKLNFNVLNQLDKAIGESLAKTGEALKTQVVIAQVVPFDTGATQNSGFVDDSEKNKGKVSLNYSTPYLRKIYFHPEYNFQKTNNANAQGEWLESYVGGENKNFAQNTFAKFYKESAGL